MLLHILPQDVVDELKSQGRTNAKSYAMASVLFADIKDFVKVSEHLSAEELVNSLDSYFEAFDNIVAGSKIEKIKTIGDAYMCVGGAPGAAENDPKEVVRVALEFERAVLRLKEEREQAGKPPFDVRIGIHTGPLVGGVVGIKKFAYDVWGDTVNVASKLQQYGEPYQISISQITYDAVKDAFRCRHQGRIEVGKDEYMEMYIVEGEL